MELAVLFIAIFSRSSYLTSVIIRYIPLYKYEGVEPPKYTQKYACYRLQQRFAHYRKHLTHFVSSHVVFYLRILFPFSTKDLIRNIRHGKNSCILNKKARAIAECVDGKKSFQ